MKTDLSKFNNSWYKAGNPMARLTWYFINLIFINSYWLPISSIKIALLRLYGAKIGKGVVIKPRVNIKYPWNLEIGDHTWIGEKAWIDNLGKVKIGSNCCLSQDSLLLCGNHNYKIDSFDLMVGDITLEDGVWIGAKSSVAGGVTCQSHSVLALGSVATSNLEPYSIYQGNPAVKVKDRVINSGE